MEFEKNHILLPVSRRPGNECCDFIPDLNQGTNRSEKEKVDIAATDTSALFPWEPRQSSFSLYQLEGKADPQPITVSCPEHSMVSWNVWTHISYHWASLSESINIVLCRYQLLTLIIAGSTGICSSPTITSIRQESHIIYCLPKKRPKFKIEVLPNLYHFIPSWCQKDARWTRHRLHSSLLETEACPETMFH